MINVSGIKSRDSTNGQMMVLTFNGDLFVKGNLFDTKVMDIDTYIKNEGIYTFNNFTVREY